MKRQLVTLFLAAFSIFLLAQEKLDQLIVHGDGFAFGVKEPEGWQADTQNAEQVGANILFFKKGESIENFSTLIYVRLNKKSDENVGEDLKWDMKEYKKKYQGIEFLDLSISHPTYTVHPKLFSLKGKFNEYVTYINPGKGKAFTLSAAMNVQKREADSSEMAAYKQVVSSLVLLKP